MTSRLSRWSVPRWLFLGLGPLLLVAAGAEARTLLSVEEALDLAFPGCEIERRTVFLTEAQSVAAEELTGEELPSRVVYPYVATCESEPEDRGASGIAWFDTHRVRTVRETIMVVVSPAGEIRRIEVLVFEEPPDYLPRGAWYDQFRGRSLGPELALDRAIRPVTGATLTARATTAAARRATALFRVVFGAPE